MRKVVTREGGGKEDDLSLNWVLFCVVSVRGL